MACGRLTRLSRGRHQGLRIEGPEYEAIYAFGGLCMIDDIAEIAHLSDLCDRLGIDTITAGNLCALAMEACERGLVDIDISYGDVEGTAALLRQIADRQGPGDLLADGIAAAARAWGVEDLAVHVKGLEPAGYDPRKLKGMGLTYGTSPRGACHLRTTFYKPELSGVIPPEQIDDKAALLIDYEDRLTIFDTLILCRFYRDLYSWEELEKTVTMVTGRQMTVDRLRTIACRIVDMTRRFNIREGLLPDMDRLPRRLTSEALPDGSAISAAEMDRLLGDYYHCRGWSIAGVPPVD